MSELYENIPDDRRAIYLRNAREVITEASEPVLHELGRAAVTDAEWMTGYDAAADNSSDEAASYAQKHSLDPEFVEKMEETRRKDVAEEAQSFLALHNAFEQAANAPKEWKHAKYSGTIADENTGIPAATRENEDEVFTISDEDIRALLDENNPPESQ